LVTNIFWGNGYLLLLGNCFWGNDPATILANNYGNNPGKQLCKQLPAIILATIVETGLEMVPVITLETGLEMVPAIILIIVQMEQF
jgi:hypothetical protein